MPRVRRGTVKSRAKVWEYSIGDPPHVVTAHERLDRNRAVTIRWWLADEKRYQRKSTGLFVRDERGVVDPELEREVVALTQQCYDELMAGRSVGLGEAGSEQSALGNEAGDAAGPTGSSGPLT